MLSSHKLTTKNLEDGKIMCNVLGSNPSVVLEDSPHVRSQDSLVSQMPPKKLPHSITVKPPTVVENGSNTFASSDRVEVVRKPVILGKENFISDTLPSRFKHEMTTLYMNWVKTQQVTISQQLSKDPNNFTLRLKLAENALLLAEMVRSFLETPNLKTNVKESCISKRDAFIEMAKLEIQDAKLLNIFNPLNYYTQSMIMEFEGVDCQDITKVEEYIRLLTQALALDPASVEINETLDRAVAYLRQKWTTLKDASSIDETKYGEWTRKLDGWLSDNALKKMFQTNPALFKLASLVKYQGFFQQHPELKSKEAFLAAYPELAVIQVPTVLSAGNIREALAQAENDPFATKLFILCEKGFINPSIAHEIKEGMLNYFSKGKALRVYVSEPDTTAITNSFKLELGKTLVEGKGQLASDILRMKGISFFIYAMHISPEFPFIKI